MYIGGTTKLKRRYSQHVSTLKNGNHDNKLLQSAANERGVQSLTFECLELCEPQNLLPLEQYYIDTLNPNLNICRVAGDTTGQRPWLGRKHSDEVKLKISESNILAKPKKCKLAKLTRTENIERFANINKDPERKRELRDKMLGNKYWLGRKHKQITIENRTGALNPNSKTIFCVELNKYFETGKQAASFFNVGAPAITNSIKRGNKIAGKYTLSYACN